MLNRYTKVTIILIYGKNANVTFFETGCCYYYWLVWCNFPRPKLGLIAIFHCYTQLPH
jgi:hypothetical protein